MVDFGRFFLFLCFEVRAYLVVLSKHNWAIIVSHHRLIRRWRYEWGNFEKSGLETLLGSDLRSCSFEVVGRKVCTRTRIGIIEYKCTTGNVRKISRNIKRPNGSVLNSGNLRTSSFIGYNFRTRFKSNSLYVSWFITVLISIQFPPRLKRGTEFCIALYTAVRKKQI